MISPEVMKELLSVRQVLHYLPASPSTDKGWTPHESQLFWMALVQYPQGPWTTIAEFIGTKSTRQAMTHGQKLRQKLKRWNKRLRRNPAVGSLMDEISASPDGRITLGSSPLSNHPMLVTTAIHPLCGREVEAPFVKIEQSSSRMKQEELRMMNSVSFPTTSGYEGHHEAGYVSASKPGELSPSYVLTSVVPSTSQYRPTGPSVRLPLLYPDLNGPRPNIPIADKLASCSDYAMAAPLSLADDEVFRELARVAWEENPQ